MNKLISVAFALIVTCILAACGPENKNSKAIVAELNKIKDTSSNNTNTRDMYASEHDAEFATDANEAILVQVELSKTALVKSSSTKVKEFATLIVSEQGKANAELKTISQPKNIVLSTKLTATYQNTLNYLNTQKGTSFDKRYIAQMLNELKNMAKLMKLQAIHGMDNELTAFAKKSIPMLKIHLKEIKQIQKGIE